MAKKNKAIEPPTSTAELRERLEKELKTAMRVNRWCEDTIDYVRDAPISLPNSDPTQKVTVSFNYRGTRSEDALREMFSEFLWDYLDIEDTSEGSDHEFTLEFGESAPVDTSEFDSRSLDEVVLAVHSVARTAMADWLPRKAAIAQILENVGIPIPIPEPTKVTVTLELESEYMDAATMARRVNSALRKDSRNDYSVTLSSDN